VELKLRRIEAEGDESAMNRAPNVRLALLRRVGEGLEALLSKEALNLRI
jgi:hypothetical protein